MQDKVDLAREIFWRKVSRRDLSVQGEPENVQVFQDGNYTVAIVEGYIGVAKFNPNDDTFLPEVGEKLAISRAVDKLLTV